MTTYSFPFSRQLGGTYFCDVNGARVCDRSITSLLRIPPFTAPDRVRVLVAFRRPLHPSWVRVSFRQAFEEDGEGFVDMLGERYYVGTTTGRELIALEMGWRKRAWFKLTGRVNFWLRVKSICWLRVKSI